MLSSTAQYLSARQTMTASRQVGTWRKVRGHIWLEMMFCSFLVMAKQRSALTQAERDGQSVHLEQAAQAPERAALVPVVEIEAWRKAPTASDVSSAPDGSGG